MLHFNGIFVVSPDWSTSHCGTKTSRPTELKIKGCGSKNFPSGSLWMIVSETISFSTTWFLDLWICAMGEWIWYAGHLFKAFTTTLSCRIPFFTNLCPFFNSQHLQGWNLNFFFYYSANLIIRALFWFSTTWALSLLERWFSSWT